MRSPNEGLLLICGSFAGCLVARSFRVCPRRFHHFGGFRCYPPEDSMEAARTLEDLVPFTGSAWELPAPWVGSIELWPGGAE